MAFTRSAILLAALLVACSLGYAVEGACPGKCNAPGDPSDTCRRCPPGPKPGSGGLPCCTGSCGKKLGCCGWDAENSKCNCLKKDKSKGPGNICFASSTGTDDCQHDCDCGAKEKCMRDESIVKGKTVVNCICDTPP